MERKNEAEVDWLNYFQSISKFCPWSLKSYKEGTMLITQFDKDILKLNEQNWSLKQWDAIVYTSKLSVDELDKFCEKRNELQEKCEYLWSHPHYTKGGNRQTHCPVIIQQDRAQLTELRGGDTI